MYYSELSQNQIDQINESNERKHEFIREQKKKNMPFKFSLGGQHASEVKVSEINYPYIWIRGSDLPEGRGEVKKHLDEVKILHHNADIPKQSGCYIATCVYGSYDCPEVWTLRRFRDEHLAVSWVGRFFIRTYYKVTPSIIEVFGSSKLLVSISRVMLNKLIRSLQLRGISDEHYSDRY
jgi:hypothetical protein